MRTRSLVWAVRTEVGRNFSHLGLASLGIAVGIAILVFVLALGLKVRAVVLGEVFPLDQLEVVPRTLDVDVWALRIGLGSEEIDEAKVERLDAIPGVARAYPKMELTVPAVLSGGAGLLGNDIHTELVADGIAPELVAADVGRGYEFRDFEADGTEVLPCRGDADCEPPAYCSGGYFEDRVCRRPIPVLASNHIVELYNGAVRRAHDLPKINPDAAVGLTAELTLGASMFTTSRRRTTMRRRLQLVGFSDLAMPVGLTMPIGYVRRFNRDFGSAEAGDRYHSVILALDSPADAPAVAQAVRTEGLEVADRGSEQAAVVIGVVLALLAMLAVVILAVAAINIMHVFLMLVAERRRQIGLMRAVGACRADIRAIVVAEAAVVGLGAGSVGLVLSRCAAFLCDLGARTLVPDFPYKPATFFAFDWWMVPAGLGFAVLFCVLGALPPAARAAGLDPAEALGG